MEKSFDIQLELSELSLLFNQFIFGLQTKLESNKSRVSINKTDLDFLIQVHEKINNIAKSDISALRSNVNTEKNELEEKLREAEINNAFKDGQLNTITNVLQLCYTDYQNSNRPDAMLAIEAAVNDAHITTQT